MRVKYGVVSDWGIAKNMTNDATSSSSSSSSSPCFKWNLCVFWKGSLGGKSGKTWFLRRFKKRWAPMIVINRVMTPVNSLKKWVTGVITPTSAGLTLLFNWCFGPTLQAVWEVFLSPHFFWTAPQTAPKNRPYHWAKETPAPSPEASARDKNETITEETKRKSLLT